MSNTKESTDFELLETADGSPSMRIRGGEPMHSLDGALSETLYIYRPTIEWALGFSDPAILSVGLGLGYNELLGAALQVKFSAPNLRIYSYESEPYLRESFLSWRQGDSSPLEPAYEAILRGLAQALEIEDQKIKSQLTDVDLRVFAALEENTEAPGLSQGILFDAFSFKTNPELWSEEFLNQFLKNFAAPHCALSTYAATGALKRSLHAADFEVEKIKGFGRKREATRAHRMHST